MPVVPTILLKNKDIAVDSETLYLWLVDHSFDRAIDSMLSIGKLK